MRQRIQQWIEDWKSKGYSDDIPDQVPDVLMKQNKAPSYRQLCLAILSNDVSLKSLGLTPKQSAYYGVLKRAEIDARPTSTMTLEELPTVIDIGTELECEEL